MRLTLATLAAVLVCFSTQIFAADITFQKALSINGATALTVCTSSGLIHVVGVDGSKVQISATVHKTNWHSMASTEDMKKIAATPPVQQIGNAIHVGDNNTCGSNVLRNIDIDYEISIPKNATVIAKTGAGTIHAESITGFVHAATGNGDVIVNGVGNDSRLMTSAGNLDIQGAHGVLQARTSTGNLTIRDSDIKDSIIEAGTGNITATNLKGGVRVNTGNGNLSLAGLPTADWEMRTGNGTIQFHADAGAKFELDAETGAGTIDSSLSSPLNGHITNGVLRGPVNGGGSVVKMYTGNGNITLQ